MADTKRSSSKTETVDVVVVVNHDDLRRGERGEVELTDNVRARLDNGYLRIAEPEDTPDHGGPVAPLGGSVARTGQSTEGVTGGDGDTADGSRPAAS